MTTPTWPTWPFTQLSPEDMATLLAALKEQKIKELEEAPF